MTARSLALTVVAMLVVAGGVYLVSAARSSDVPGSSQPAAATPAAESRGSATASTDPDRRRMRPPVPPIARDDGDDAEIEAGPGGPTAAPHPRIDLRGSVIKGADREAAPTSGITATDRLPVPDHADPDPEIEATMRDVAALYDRGEHAAARGLAMKLLGTKPGSARMLRVVVAVSCQLGDAATATKYAAELAEADRAAMATRCARYGVTLDDV